MAELSNLPFNYDPQADAGSFVFGDGEVVETEEVSPDVFVDFNENAEIVGIEILNVSKNAPGLIAKKRSLADAK